MRYLILFVLTAFSLMALGQTEGLLNKLLAPGPVVKGHVELEKKDCLKCHDAGKGVPDEKCLDCHKNIKPFVDSKKGFHGLTTQACFECHSEHKGRDYDSVDVDDKNFDHSKLTGYSLEGKHADIKCSECHKATYSTKFVRAGKIRYIGNQSTCISCHKKDDIHFFKGNWAKKDCVACHTLKSWKDGIKFNHEKDGKYKLEGKHAEMKCTDCHGLNKRMKYTVYKWPNLKKQQCLSCHADFHKNNLSRKYQNGQCTKCHNQNEWKLPKFDHQLTGYQLKGKHFEIKCIECHKQKTVVAAKLEVKHFNFTGLKTACVTCHENYHRFGKIKTKNFGDPNNCQNCHNEKKWTEIQKFDHNIHTRYAIDGEHKKLNCTDCHLHSINSKQKFSIGIYSWPTLQTKTCEACHKNPHTKQFSPDFLKKKCDECHVTTGWYDMKNGKGFDHAKTRFPLTGAHTKTKCVDCHGPSGKQTFKFKTFESKFCIDCHQNIHKNQFSNKYNSQNCTQCHSTENFTQRLQFDHTKTQYPLEGAHNKLKCEECHKPNGQSVYLVKPNIHRVDKGSLPERVVFKYSQFLFPKVKKTECLECHTDYHKNQLGSQCLNCHNLETWKKIKFDHNKQSRFPLREKHEQAICIDCHKPMPNEYINFKNQKVQVVKYKPFTGLCVDCHKDVHNGSFGKSCQECHSEKGWKITKDFHKNFTLTGVHYTLSCNECHTNSRTLSGMSQRCNVCHAKDDIHSGALPNCQECHRQQFWEVTGFKHSLTSFPLRGAHRTLDCMECHRNGTYKGLISTCASCHLQQGLAVTVPLHSGFSNINQCNACHLNQFSW